MKISFKRIILFLITCLFLLLIFINLDFLELIKIIKNFNCKYIILITISIICSLSLRGVCFKQLISKTINAPLKNLIPLCLTGAALNIILPARAGDFFRAWYTGAKYNADKIKILGSIILERILDGIIIFFLLLAGLITHNTNPLALKLLYCAGFFFISCLLIAFLIFKYNKTDTICNFIKEKADKLPKTISHIINNFISYINKLLNSFINGFEILLYPKKLIYILFSVFGIWFFECLCYYFTIQGFGIEVNPTVVLFIISFIALASMIPSTSIFIGPYQIAVISAFSIYGINKETAIAISVTEQAIITLTVSICATLFLVKNNISYKEIKQDVIPSKK